MADISTSKFYTHPIAQSYFDKIAAAGGDVVNKNIINNFVDEMCKIVHPSLWVCWPLRSAQNIGTGNTVYSLGGMGNFPGTLTNGPMWSTNGFTISATMGCTASPPVLTDNLTLLVVTRRAVTFTTFAGAAGKSGTGASNTFDYGFQSGSTNGTRFQFVVGDGVVGGGASSTAVLTDTTTFHMHAGTYSSLNPNRPILYGDKTVTINGAVATTTLGNSNAFVVFGQSGISQTDASQQYAFTALFSTPITQTTNNLIYDIVKNTIATGLPMP